MKKRIILLMLFLFISLTVVNIGFTRAANNIPLIPSWMEDSGLFRLFVDTKDTSAIAEFTKLMILLLVIMLVYSALSYAGFPKNPAVRIGVSVVVGFLSTVLIANDELVAAMWSYKALGIALMLFFPILILAFLTFAVASKVDPMGIVVQRVMWILYSVYLAIETGVFLIFQWAAASTPNFDAGKFINQSNLTKFFLGGATAATVSSDKLGNNTILLLLFIVSIFVFYIFVIKNQALTEWLAKQRRDADLLRHRDTSERAHGATEIAADQTRR